MWHPANGGQPVSPQDQSRNNLPQCDGNNLDDLNYSLGNNDDQDNNNSYDFNNNDNSNQDEHVSAREIKQYREIFNSLAILFPDKFEATSQDVPQHMKQFKDQKCVNKLKIDPNLEGSWYFPSNKEESDDSVGYWPPNTRFPSETVTYLPRYNLKPPQKTFRHFHSRL